MFFCFSCFSWFFALRSGLGALSCLAVDSDFLYSLHPNHYFLLFACVFMLFMLFMVFAFTERPGRLELLSRGQRFPVFPASRLLFPAFCLCFPAFHAFHGFWLYGAAWLGALGCLAVDSDFLYSLHPDYYFLLSACVFLLFLVFMIFACTKRLGALDGSDSEK